MCMICVDEAVIAGTIAIASIPLYVTVWHKIKHSIERLKRIN